MAICKRANLFGCDISPVCWVVVPFFASFSLLTFPFLRSLLERFHQCHQKIVLGGFGTYWSKHIEAVFLGNVRARFLAQIVAQTCHVYWCSLLKVPFFVGLNIPHKSFSLKHHFTSLFFPADPLPGNHYYYLPIFVGWPGWPPPTGCHSWVKSSTSEASVAPCWGRWPFKDGCRRHALLPYRRYRVMWKIWWGKSQRSWWVPSGKLT